MIPYKGDYATAERRTKTFDDFMALSDEARELALLKKGCDFNVLFDQYLREYHASNDNEATGDEVVLIVLNNELWQMLLCWEQCNKDMVLTKLTYVQGHKYGESVRDYPE